MQSRPRYNMCVVYEFGHLDGCRLLSGADKFADQVDEHPSSWGILASSVSCRDWTISLRSMVTYWLPLPGNDDYMDRQRRMRRRTLSKEVLPSVDIWRVNWQRAWDVMRFVGANYTDHRRTRRSSDVQYMHWPTDRPTGSLALALAISAWYQWGFCARQLPFHW